MLSLAKTMTVNNEDQQRFILYESDEYVPTVAGFRPALPSRYMIKIMHLNSKDFLQPPFMASQPTPHP